MNGSPLGLFVAAVLLALLIPLAWLRPETGLGIGRSLSVRMTAIVKPWMAAPLCGLVAVAGSMAFSFIVRFPVPRWHDEFSYLLAADTYASGRLTNPTPFLWEHFETFHILQTPSYISKYPPGQGLILALGQVLGGHPVLGIWLGTGIACALIFWMLKAWVPYRWALLGGLLAALSLGFSSPWSQEYWGGSLAAAGGALVLGGIRRMSPTPKASHGLAIGLGLVILAISRPFEGVFLSLPVAALLGAWLLGLAPGPRPRSVLSACLVITAVLAPGALAMAHYNKATTGHWGRMPYAEYEQQYGIVPVFLWAKTKAPPTYVNDIYERFEYGAALPRYTFARTLPGFLLQKLPSTFLSLIEFLHFALLGPLLFAILAKRRGWDGLALLCCGMVLAAVLGNTWTGSRMTAPMAGGMFFLAIQGLRRLRLWRPGDREVGRGIARAVVVATVASTVIGLVPTGFGPLSTMPQEREQLIRNLESSEERHLIFVRYSPEHNPHEEWVFNRANLEEAQVIWARARTPKENLQLLTHYAGRRVWLFEPDNAPRTLFPYDPGAPSQPPSP